MENVLDNPVYHALISGDAHLAGGNNVARYFEPEVSPFAGFPIGYNNGFNDLLNELPADRRILFASITPVEHKGWQQAAYIQGSQFVFDTNRSTVPGDEMLMNSISIVPLTASNAEEMVALAALTKPGPFDRRTIEFGSYHGVFENGKLAAMTGQRLHPFDHTELSAVCTHPDFLGRGYATALLVHQLKIILQTGKTPFLHVRSDNARAIAVYERLGFTLRSPMHFYFLKRAV